MPNKPPTLAPWTVGQSVMIYNPPAGCQRMRGKVASLEQGTGTQLSDTAKVRVGRALLTLNRSQAAPILGT